MTEQGVDAIVNSANPTLLPGNQPLKFPLEVAAKVAVTEVLHFLS